MKAFSFAVTAIISFGALSASAAAQDAAKGATIFRQKCAQCHQIGAGAKKLIGPPLNGVVGKEIASVPGFTYSPAYKKKKAEKFVWTEEHISQLLEKPMKFIPGTRMAFVGLPNPADRQNVIAYLKSFNDKGEKAAAN